MMNIYKKFIFIIGFILLINNNLLANNLISADNRFTVAASTSDYAQCTALYGVYYAAKKASFVLTNLGCFAVSGFACPPLAAKVSLASAIAVFFAVSYAYNEWAEDIGVNSKVVNTLDPLKNECSANLLSSVSNWEESGPLGDYCYKKEYDRQDRIGISYRGNEPVWIAPQDCDTIATNSFEDLVGTERQFCAWVEGDEICAEAVFCSGLLIGDFIPPNSLVGGAYKLPEDSRRNCGDNPYNDERVDDFNNGRCECYCCDGSNKNKDCNNVDSSCQTYNERYRAHCVKRAIPKEEIDNKLQAPRSLSMHCRASTESGYKDFSFIGKTVRCVSKTIENLYFGREDKIIKNDNGSVKIDLKTNSPEFKNQCIDGAKDNDGNCVKSLQLKMQKNFANVISIFLTLWIAILGAKFLLGSGMTAAELSKAMLQLSVILYFVSGTGWKDGYYKFLMNAGYELSSAYLEATMKEQEKFEFIDKTQIVAFKDQTTGQCKVDKDESSTIQVVSNVNLCNFTKGLDPLGYKYPKGDAYYGVLDSLDCRFSKYIGLDRNNYFPEILTIAFVAMFQTASGFMFLIVVMAFLYISIILLLRVSFMLASITIMISFLIFISPLIIPLMLFSKTKKIFDKWLANLLGYSLQPFIIIVLISLFIVLIDGFFIAYLAPIYDSTSAAQYFETNLGIKAPLQGGTAQNHDDAFMGILRFMFLLVVMMSIFNKVSSLLQQLTGVGGIENYINTPDFSKGMNYGAGVAYNFVANVGGAATSRLRKSINEDHDNDKTKDINLNNHQNDIAKQNNAENQNDVAKQNNAENQNDIASQDNQQNQNNIDKQDNDNKK